MESLTRSSFPGIAGALALAGLVLLAAPATGQGYPDTTTSDYGGGQDSQRGSDGPFSLRTGLGFSIDPDTFLMGFEGDYRIITEGFSVGTQVQLGLDDDLTLVSPVFYGRYTVDLGEFNRSLDRVAPYLQGGLGFTWWEIDRRFGGDDDDTEFLLNFGFGVEYRLTEHVSAGTHMLFNLIPDKIYGERFYYSWEVATLRYRF
jgi:opacity protein-like surface antigen